MTDLNDIAASLDPESRAQLYVTAARDSLRASIQSCTLCPLHETSVQRVPWEGGPSPVAIIGEAPGASEDRVGRPFVGAAGKLLDSVLAQVGLSRGSVAIINRICCRPPSNDYELAEKLGAPAACAGWFNAQLAINNSWMLVLMGNSALSAFSPKNISSVRGKRWWQDGFYLIPTYHPAYALRNPNAAATISADLAPIANILKGLADAPVANGYDPNHAVASLRAEPLTERDRVQFRKHYNKHHYVVFFSTFLGERIVMSETLQTVVHPEYHALPRYTVAEVEKLSRWTTKTWEDLRRVHAVKVALGGEVLV